MGDSPGNRPRLRHRLLLIGLGALFAIGAAEGLVRGFGALTGSPGPGDFLQRDAQLGWRNRPGFRGRHTSADFDVAVCFDGAGRRCAERGPSDGSRSDHGRGLRVLAIGDSTTFGWGVEAEAAFPAQLSERLGVEVENWGVSGYGPDQQLLLLRELLSAAASVAPRLVIVTHTANDTVEVLQEQLYRRSKPRFVPDGERLRLAGVPTPCDWLTEYSHLWRTIQKRTGGFDLDAPSPAAVAAGRDLVRRLYRELRQECDARGITLLLVGHDADWLGAAAAEDAIRYLDLSPVFARLERSGAIRFANDPHWLPRVHAAIADEIAAFVERERLLAH